ncbi:Hsp70 family protein [Actinokineospora guangxiensis]|uniref:Hsp70 family protein n=1 Tax=Actinokineospora guangxiensis TaxID=1490288 RepID=A0ABW0EGH2_9PSEU
MHYGLGVDLGTTFTAAAVSGPRGTRMVPLGPDVVTPSAVFASAEGRLLTGTAATAAGAAEPSRLSVGHKRRLGDPTPLVIGGAAFSAAALLAAQLRDVLGTVVSGEGAPPAQVVLTCPAVWGPYRREHFDEVPQLAGVRDVRVVTEPEAAATHYAVERRLGEGELIAVYDLGGGTFDTTILRARPGGMEIIGTPEGVERLGGMDFDDALLAHLDSRLDGAITALDPADPTAATALAAIRALCVRAKEDLSTEPDVTLAVPLPGGAREVLVTRLEFNDMIRPAVALTTEALERTITSAGLKPQDLSAVLLAGGSSRIPLVSQMVSSAFGRPVRASLHPKFTVALGAAATARATPPAAASPPPGTPPSGLNPVPPLPAVAATSVKRRPKWVVPAAAAGVLLLVGGLVAGFTLFGGDDGNGARALGGPSQGATAPAQPPGERVLYQEGDVQPYKSIIGSAENWTGTHVGVDRSASHAEITISPDDLGDGRKGLRASWSGSGAAQLYFQDIDGTQDMTDIVSGDGALVFDVVVYTPPTDNLTVQAHCRYPCKGVLEATGLFAGLPVGEKTTVRVPLSCFVDKGLKPDQVDTYFLIYTEGRFEAAFDSVRWVKGAGADSDAVGCADLTSP